MKCLELCARWRPVYLAATVLTLLSSHSFSAERSQGVSLKEAARLLRERNEGDIDKDEKRCGISCLYLFLKLHGMQPQLSEIEKLVPLGEHGASLQSLADASQRLGLRASPILCDPDDLAALPLPAIAHMERFGDAKPFLHYVVITNVSKNGVDLFDPFDSRPRFFNYSQLSQIFSGYTLVATPHPLSRPDTQLGIAGFLLAAIGMWRIARTRPRSETVKSLRVESASLVVAVVCSIAGCGAQKPTVPPKVVVTEKAKEAPIKVEKSILELGQLPSSAIVEGEFRFRNISPKSLTLRLGPSDCSCIKAELKPADVLEPGAEGRLLVQLDTSKKNEAGMIETCATVFVGETPFQQKFCVRGVLEGIVFPHEMYVIRPNQRATPKFEFAVVAHNAPEFQLSKITCASIPEFSQMVTGGRVNTAAIVPKGTLTADVEYATVAAPQIHAGELFSVRQVSVPMHFDSSAEAYGGMIIVDYVLGGKERQAITKSLVVAPE